VTQEVLDRTDTDARGLMRLGIVVALITALSIALKGGGGVIVVSAIFAMIMFHELGHFVTAKWAGMKATDFFVGFGPVIWATQRGETRWGVRAFPIGGYVRVIGMNNLEEVDPAEEHRTYRSKSYWQRVRFACAGTATHFIIAFVLMMAFLAFCGKTQVTTTIDSIEQHAPSGGGPSAAVQAGFHKGDRLLAIDGHPIKKWEDARQFIHDSPNKQVTVVVERAGRQLSLPVTPALVTAGGQSVGVIGIVAGEEKVKDHSLAVPWHAAVELKTLTVESTKGLFALGKPDNVKNYGKQLTKTGPVKDVEKDGNRLLSPIGLFRLAAAAFRSGPAAVLTLLIAINIFVGIFNMLPLPPFDGGHVAVASYEAVMSRIKGRRHMLDMNKMLPIAYAMVALLAFLSLTAAWLDIRHPFQLG
jgi:membrane-associated protease RseP (regulator of RpoE activity)